MRWRLIHTVQSVFDYLTCIFIMIILPMYDIYFYNDNLTNVLYDEVLTISFV